MQGDAKAPNKVFFDGETNKWWTFYKKGKEIAETCYRNTAHNLPGRGKVKPHIKNEINLVLFYIFHTLFFYFCTCRSVLIVYEGGTNNVNVKNSFESVNLFLFHIYLLKVYLFIYLFVCRVFVFVMKVFHEWKNRRWVKNGKCLFWETSFPWKKHKHNSSPFSLLWQLMLQKYHAFLHCVCTCLFGTMFTRYAHTDRGKLRGQKSLHTGNVFTPLFVQGEREQDAKLLNALHKWNNIWDNFGCKLG